GATIFQFHRGSAIGTDHGLRGPEALVETDQAAMGMIGAVIARKLVGVPIELKAGAGDAPRHASDNGPKIGMTGEIGIERIKPEPDIVETAFAIRHAQVGDNPAV